MNDSTLSSAVVNRVLQVTRQAWAQTPARAAGGLAPPSPKLSSHRLARLQGARHPAPPWGLQRPPGLARAPKA